MGREITLEDIRDGDKIRVTREFTVISSAGTDRHGHQFLVSEYPGIRAFIPPEATIELLDRPIDLPTKKGSVIRVRTQHWEGAGVNEGTWILTQNLSGRNPEWVSASRIHLDPDGFKQFLIETPLRTFEVIG